MQPEGCFLTYDLSGIQELVAKATGSAEQEFVSVENAAQAGIQQKGTNRMSTKVELL
jgi:hypothetical protein